jgi:hypothetical protein
MRSIRALSSIHISPYFTQPGVKYIDYPSCKNCIHYKPNIFHSDFTSRYSRCDKFGEKNVITDNIDYIIADVCRNDNSLCGIEGKYFEKEHNLHKKMIHHLVMYNIPLFGILSPLILMIIYVKI